MACPLHQKQCFEQAGIPNSTPVTTWQKVGILDSHILVNVSRAEGELLLCGSSRTNSHV
jgi:hypothetical protein